MKRSATHSDAGRTAESKRPRIGDSRNSEEECQLESDEKIPRRVLHLRGLADEMEASDIVQYAMPFGKIKNMVFAKKKHQALLEMEELQAAKSMVSYYKDRPPKFGRKTIYIQFSNYDELDKDLTTQHANVIKAVHAANESMETPGKVTPVLRVFIENKIHPVTLLALKQIFSKYGEVQKIVTFTKNSIWQALIQMPDIVAAQNAKIFLNGKNVYDGCCTLKIEYSRQETLSIRYNNDKSFDFTNPNLPQGPDNEQDVSFDLESGGSGILGNPMLDEGLKNPSLLGPGGGMGLLGAEGLGLGGLGGINPVAAAQFQLSLARELSTLESLRGGPVAANILEKLTGLASLAGLGSLQQNAIAFNDYGLGDSLVGGSIGSLSALGGRYGLEDDRRAGRSRDFSLDRGERRMDRSDALDNMMRIQTGGGRVILVSNLNDQKISTDAIFVLFGVYGNVLRVKILYNKKDSALIEYEEDYQAHDAVENLNRVRWHEKTINVVLSKHSSVKMPKDGSEEPWLTKDYSGSKLHRFRKSNSKNHRHIFPPSSTLHLSNIPPTTTEQSLVDLFKEYGRVTSFKFSPNDRKIAWIKMDSTQSAIEALVGLHDYELARTSHLRVSFTGYTL